jgi:hypothetical protein
MNTNIEIVTSCARRFGDLRKDLTHGSPVDKIRECILDILDLLWLRLHSFAVLGLVAVIAVLTVTVLVSDSIFILCVVSVIDNVLDVGIIKSILEVGVVNIILEVGIIDIILEVGAIDIILEVGVVNIILEVSVIFGLVVSIIFKIFILRVFCIVLIDIILLSIND